MVLEMKVKGLALDPLSNMPMIILRDEEEKRSLPIWVGLFEANAIALELEKIPTPRPLTHDLIGSIFKGFGISLERVIISELRHSTYFARLILKAENELGMKLIEIDARPSDCIALAVANGRPIFVAGPLFEQVDDMSEILDQLNQSNPPDRTDEEEGS